MSLETISSKSVLVFILALAPGKYKVEIRWAKSTGEKVKEPVYGHSPYVFAEAIPEKYNAESMLKAELSEGSNELHFRLEK